MKAQPRIGQIVNATVSRVMAGGLFVDVTDCDARGVIKAHEIASSQSPISDDLKRQFNIGDQLQAIVIERRDDGRLELSIRQLKHDPWSGVSARLKKGQLVDGVATNFEPYGVFIELPQGVTGLLHISKLPARLDGAPADLFWPGDHVKVVVEAIDEDQRRISLSMVGLAEKRWPLADETEHSAKTQPGKESKVESDTRRHEKSPVELLMEQPPQRILIVEDDKDHRQAITNWLKQAGQSPYPVESGEEALRAAAEFHPDAALVDLGLPGIDGVETLRRLLSRQPELRAVMMTAGYDREMDIRDLEAKGFRLLMKPLHPSELVEFLIKMPAQLASSPHEDFSDGRVHIDSLDAKVLERPDGLNTVLESLLSRTKARKAIVFSLDPTQRKVSILAQAGQGHLDMQSLPGLTRSPVRDVAEDGIVVRTDDAYQKTEEGRFRYLQLLMPFASSIGVPIRANLPLHFALFIFHTKRSAFSESHRDLTIAYAYALANMLERQAFIEQSSELQRLALLGQLSRALVHEVNHRLSPVGFALATLQGGFGDINRTIDESSGGDAQTFDSVVREFRNARKSLDLLATGVSALIHTARLFGQMAKADHETGMLVLSDVSQEVASLIHDTAEKHHVKILTDIPDTMVATRTQIALVRQVLLNVVLNAVQQIALYRPQEGGRVRISVNSRLNVEKPVVCIQVEDDGPGIHRRLWNQIFQLGFTTRKDGSGLGLHLSRSLIESLGGRIYVSDSRLYWGTIFTIELPSRS